MTARSAAVILGAGASTRMGRPKLAIRWGDRSFARHLADRALELGLEPVVLVWGAAEPPGDVRDLPGLVLRHNPAWRQGPLSSLRAGLGTVPEDRRTLVLTADRPHVRRRTLAALLEASTVHPDAVVQPVLDGRRGHPLVLPPAVCARIRAGTRHRSLREVLADEPRHTVAVDDPAVLDNLDRPEDLSKLPDPC